MDDLDFGAGMDEDEMQDVRRRDLFDELTAPAVEAAAEAPPPVADGGRNQEPAAAQLQPRRSSRVPSVDPTTAYCPEWSGYDMGRSGSRHDRVNEHTYQELLDERKSWEQQLQERALQTEAWLHEVDQLVLQCEAIVREMPTEHAPAIRALQEALMDMVAEAEDDDGGEDAPAGFECPRCESEPTDQEKVASAFFEQVAEELAWTDPTSTLPSVPLAVLRASFNGSAGGLMITAHQFLWVAMGSHFSQAGVRLPLASIRRQHAAVSKSPFGSRAELAVATRDGGSFAFQCGSQLAETEAFSREVQLALEALPATTATAATSAAGAAAAASPATAPVRRQTKQVLAAADLRAKLKEVVKEQRSHTAGSNAKAAAILEGLAGADPKEPSMNTVYKASQQLRDVALGFGGFNLAKKVLEQFLKTPAVRLCLPEDMRERQAKMADAEHAVELMGHAKEFFTSIFGVGFRGGRRSDEDRNAFAAASAAFCPRDLFARRGRAAAAARLSGLGYRQLHRGSDYRRELEDSACGWKRVNTAEHKDKLNYGPLNEFWHSDLASTEDNQNKDLIRVFLGVDPITKEQLYDLHPRRAMTCTLRGAVPIFRASTFAAQMAAASVSAKRPAVGRRQLAAAKCACVKERKASQCDCQKCTQVTLSLGRFNLARAGWHSAFANANGGKGCSCPLHSYASEEAAAAAAVAEAARAADEAAAKHAILRMWEQHVDDHASSAGSAAAAAAALTADAAASTAKVAVEAATAKLTAAKLRVERYASLSTSEEALMAALLPCGKREYPEQTVVGEKTFKSYSRSCCEDNCPNKGNLFERRKGSVCGYALVFEGYACPIDNSDDEFVWQRWMKMLRNANKERETDDGKAAKPSYSIELVPHRGTRREFMIDLFGRDGHVREWLPHKRRVRWCRQVRRLIDDHKSGKRVTAAALREAICRRAVEKAREAARASSVRLEALQLVAQYNPPVNMGVVASAVPPPVVAPNANGADKPVYIVVYDHRCLPLTLAAMVRVVARDEADGAAAAMVATAEAALTAATGRVQTATEVCELMKLTMTVQSDYAAQFETYRIHTGTCAQPERHNFLVSIVGYKPYTEMMRKAGRGKKSKILEPVQKQHVDIFYAFHKAGFKPSARSFNVVQEDIDHFLLHSTFLHGEWFTGGQRCPGGDHREPLTDGLTERPLAPADFPEARQRLDIFDGCPNQFAYGDNFHQIATWRAKTSRWAKDALVQASATTADATTAAARVAAAVAISAVSAAAIALAMWKGAAARGAPATTFNLNAAVRTHQRTVDASSKLAKLVTAADATAAAARDAAAAVVRSPSAIAQVATLATAMARLASSVEAAVKEALVSAAVVSREATLSALASASAQAIAAARACEKAAASASTAICPPTEMEDAPASPTAAAAIAAAPALNGIVRLALKLVEHHGKSGCDGNSNTPVRAVKHAIEHKLMGPNPGTQELVRFLAINKPVPLIPKAEKRGWEAIGRIFYGFMNTDRFTKTVVPDTDGSKFKDSTKHHSFVGRHVSPTVFESGEMQACHEFCACSECLLGRYLSCELKPEMGAMHGAKVPFVSGVALRQLEELAAWGEMLCNGMLVGYTADRRETHLEGNYWLALLKGPAYPVAAENVHASDQFEEGWLVVKAHWFELVTTSPRCYKLQHEERTLIVNEMIRLSGIKWDKVIKRSPRLGDTQYFLSEDWHNTLTSCVRAQPEQEE